MTALRFDLAIEQGADYQVAFPVLNAAGADVDVTGWTARAQVRRRAADTTVLADLAPTVAGTEVTVTVPAATSSAWAWTAGVYDLELTDPSGEVTRLAQGRVVLLPETTR